MQQIKVSPALTHQPGWRQETMAELDDQFGRIFRACLRHYRRTGEVPLTLFRRQRGDSADRPEPSSMCAAGRHDKYSSYGRCDECRYVADCGVCPVSIVQERENTDPNRIPDFQCAYNLVSLKYRERFPRRPSARERLIEGPKGLRALLPFTQTR